MSRVAGILVNIVPYHHARWEAFAQTAGMACEVVEMTQRDAFRVLEFSAGARYRRRTLFPNDTQEAIPGKTLNRAMAAALDEFRPEVVCISGYAYRASLAALQWAVRRRVPVVVLSESNEFDEQRSAPKEFIKRRMVGLCAAGLAGGTPQADYLVRLGLPAGRVFAGYDVVDNRYFEDKVAEIRNPKSEIRNKYGLPEHYFLACCRFGEKKNIPRLLQAYARYRGKAESAGGNAEKLKSEKLKGESTGGNTGGNAETLKAETLKGESSGEGVAPISDLRPLTSDIWSLVLLGDGPLKADLCRLISDLSLQDSVVLPGAKPYAELPAYYGLASAFVHASTTEQWGLVVNEAMASGLPVLVSNRCGCAQDLVQDGVNGFTFDPCNVEQLSDLMLRISAFQPFSLSAFGLASQRIISEWGPERFASGLKAAVDKALEVGPVKPTLLQRTILKALLAR